MMHYWLMKSEPACYSIDDLYHAPLKTTAWDGVRNYQARNYMRQMRIGDLVFFYHSNANPPGIAGIAEVVREAYPDYTAFSKESEHFDPKSTPDNPRWSMVDVRFKKKFSEIITLNTLKNHPELAHVPLVKKGNRLSVMPIDKAAWAFIEQHLIIP